MSSDHTASGGEGDLAAEVAALRRRARETDAIARESAAVLSELAPHVHDLTQAQASEAADGNAGTAQQTGIGDQAGDAARAELGMADVPPAPWCWPLFDDEQATAAWEALARWVDRVLVPGYGITRGELPDCWPHHPRMVNELSWLRAAHLDAHQDGAAATLAQDWHLRALPGALAAVAAAVPLEHGAGSRRRPLCGPGHHHSRTGVHEDETQQAAGMLADAEHRHPTAGPAIATSAPA